MELTNYDFSYSIITTYDDYNKGLINNEEFLQLMNRQYDLYLEYKMKTVSNLKSGGNKE